MHTGWAEVQLHSLTSVSGWVRRSQWPRGLSRWSVAARLLRSWVRIPPGAWMFVWVLSGRGLCDEVITRPEESYRLWCVVVCDLETSWMRRPWPTGGLLSQKKERRLGWVHTCNVTAYRNTLLWQCGRDSWPRNVSKVGYAVTLRACSVCCR